MASTDAVGAQEPSSGGTELLQTGALPAIGSAEEEAGRLRQLHEGAADGFLLRTPSSELIRGTTMKSGVVLLLPEVQLHWRSALPDSRNESTAWSGRGWSYAASGGVGVRVGPATLVVAPEFTYAENRGFDIVPNRMPNRSEYSLWWFADTLSIDLPVRFGDAPRSGLHLGQSSLTVEGGPVAVGGGTENHWWGPGIRNAIVLSNNAPGFPHVFARSARPWHVGVGRLEWVWLAGEVASSQYFDPVSPDSIRSLSGFAATFAPAGIRNLHFGIARTVYSQRDPSRGRLDHAPDVFTDWSGSDEVRREERDRPSEQIVSLFGRWVAPQSGFEVYGEWARYRLPLSVRDLLEQPHHSQGYTLGVQWLGTFEAPLRLRLNGEVTNLERSVTYRLRPIGSYYTSLEVPHGYTHRGKVLGASIGPGSSSQWLAADVMTGRYRLGLFGERVRWNNDAYFRNLAPWLFFGHDVELAGGVRGGVDLARYRVQLTLTRSERMNYLFQNFGNGWDEIDNAVDITNHRLELMISPLPR